MSFANEGRRRAPRLNQSGARHLYFSVFFPRSLNLTANLLSGWRPEKESLARLLFSVVLCAPHTKRCPRYRVITPVALVPCY